MKKKKTDVSGPSSSKNIVPGWVIEHIKFDLVTVYSKVKT